MSDERARILDMLARGVITAEEASELLEALAKPAGSPSGTPSETPTIIDADSGAVIDPAPPPDFSRYRTFWRYPFAASVAVMGVAGLLLAWLYTASSGWATVGLFCVWPLMLLAIVATLLSTWSRYAPWIHVRVKQRRGRRIAISFPIPLGLARWGLKRGRRFAPAGQEANLSAVAALLEQMEPGRGDPLMIDVDDEDGDHVQVFIG